MTLAVFDLDGTITRKDTFLEFLKFTHGKKQFYINFLLLSPFVVAFYLKLYANHSLKKRVLKWFYGGANAQVVQQQGNTFAKKILPDLCYAEAIERLNWHQTEGHEVVILSASCSLWIQAWCEKQGYQLICTEMEIQNGHYTGDLVSENCYGLEKIHRLKNKYDLENSYLYAYGDTPSDKYFLALANEAFYKLFSK